MLERKRLETRTIPERRDFHMDVQIISGRFTRIDAHECTLFLDGEEELENLIGMLTASLVYLKSFRKKEEK